MNRKRKLKLTASALAVFMVLLTPNVIAQDQKGEVLGETVRVLNPIEDAYVLKGHPDTNFGSSNLAIYQDLDENNTGYSYLQFPTPALPVGHSLVRAQLQLTVGQGDSCITNGINIHVGRVQTPWRESSITWNNKPNSFVPETYSTSNCGRQTLLFPVTSIVRYWQNSGSNYGVIIYGQNNGSYKRVFSPSEAPSGSAVPKLIVTYSVPDAPAANQNSGNSGSSSQNPSSVDPVTNVPTSASTPASSAAAAPVDTTIDEPTFMYAMRNGQQAELGANSTLEADTKDKVTIIGAGVPGNKVAVFVDKYTYEYNVNSLGYWGVTFPVEQLKVGDYRIEAQAQKDGKGSERAFMLNLKRTDLRADAKALASQSRGMDWMDRLSIILFYVWPFISLGFWILVIVVIVLLVKRHKRKKAQKEAAAQVQATPAAAPAESEAQPAPKKVKKK